LHHCDVRHCVRPDHLFLGIHTDNMTDMVRKNRQAKGDLVNTSKLTADDVREIRAAYAAGSVTYKQLGEQYGVRRTNIHMIVSRQTWKHI
jgi:hypothetical protein